MASTRIVLLMAAAMAVGAFLCTAELIPRPNGKGIDPRCHKIHYDTRCNTFRISFDKSWNITGWTYDVKIQSCRPVFTPKGKHDCKENEDLPKSREECENICGQSCIMGNGEVGVCVSKMHCTVFSLSGTDTKPCGTKVNCCPKITDSSLVFTNRTVFDKHFMFERNLVTKSSNDSYYYTYLIPGHKDMISK